MTKPPTRLGGAAVRDLMAPLQDALIALRLHRASESHYHDLAAAITILYRVSESVAKHRHLLPEIQPAVGALNAIYDRRQQRTVESFWSGTEAEIDAIQTAVEIYRAVILTTTGPRMANVIRRVARDLTQDALK
ncbi:MAG: hypothetical protein WCX93_00290 [Burkholderiaceae bacterium]